MKATVACAQMHPVLGDVPANLRTIAELAGDAVHRHGADLVVLPESATTGLAVARCDQIRSQRAPPR